MFAIINNIGTEKEIEVIMLGSDASLSVVIHRKFREKPQLQSTDYKKSRKRYRKGVPRLFSYYRDGGAGGAGGLKPPHF